MRQLKKSYISSLANLYDESETLEIFEMCISSICDMSHLEFVLSLSSTASDEVASKALAMLDELKSGKPVQYVLGFEDYMGMHLMVDERVLIPRPETLELIHAAAEAAKAMHSDCSRILDVGTGSGCIALGIKSLLGNAAAVTAADVSCEALDVARYNAESNKLDILFLEIDALSQSFQSLQQTFDVIVSNPPYIKPSEMSEMRQNVLDYEPHLALFVPEDDPLLFYRAIATFASTHLSHGGMLLFEINEALAAEMETMLSDIGLTDIQIIKDFYGKDRIVTALRPTA